MGILKKLAALLTAGAVLLGSSGILPENTLGITAAAEIREEEQFPVLEPGVLDFKVDHLSDDEALKLIEESDKRRENEMSVRKETRRASDGPDISEYKFSSDYIYDQMTDAQKALYDGIKAECEAFESYKGDLEQPYLPNYVVYDADSLTDTEIRNVGEAFYYSNPQYYFLKNGLSQWADDGKLYVFVYILSDFIYEKNRTEYRQAINELTASWMPEIEAAEGDYAKEKVIYEKLIDHITYGTKDAKVVNGQIMYGYNDQTIAGALVDGLCVCNGYAMAMSYFCNAVGIENVIYVSWIHAWNVVKLDGEWMHIDVTWMDGGSVINYNYCNIDYPTILGDYDHTAWNCHVHRIYDHTGWKVPLEIDPSFFIQEDDERQYDENGFLINKRNELLGYAGKSGDIVIPDGVVSIEAGAFQNGVWLTSVVIPDSVREINCAAFKNCNHLKKVTLSENLLYIYGSDYPGGAFEGCTSLETIIIPDSVKLIGVNTFKDCSGLKDITVGKNVEEIEHGVFMNCTGLESIVLPDSLKKLDQVVFENCSNLKNVTLGSKLTELDGFIGCISLESIKIPDTVKIIAENCFSGCTALNGVKLNSGLKTIGESAFSNCTSMDSLTIPDTVETIENYAFRKCSSLDGAIVIPDSVTLLGKEVFTSCSEIDSVAIGTGIDKIDKYSFAFCSDLKSVTFGDNIRSIGENAFFECVSLESFTIPDSVTELGDYVLYNCSSLTSIDIPESITVIPDGAFMNCFKLSEINLPDCITEIGDYAFCGTAISTFKFPASLNKIGSGVFLQCNDLDSVTISANCIEVPSTAFSLNTNIQNIYVEDGNKYYKSIDGILLSADGKELVKYPAGRKLKYYTVPDGVEKINTCAFQECTDLKEITLPDGLKEIGGGAFQFCNSIQSIDIPDSIEYIGTQAFYECTGLTEVTVPAGKIDREAFSCMRNLETFNIGAAVDTVGINPFVSSPKLTTINVDPLNKYFKSVDNVLFSADGKRLISYPFGKVDTSYTVPEGTEVIEDKAFSRLGNDTSCDHAFTSVTLCDSIKNIKESAFEECSTLESVDFPSSLETISKYAFKNCVNLKKAILPENAILIDDEAFSGCSGLTEAVLPLNITYIPDQCFKDCVNLKEIVIPDNVVTIDWSAFSGCKSLKNILFGKKNRVIGEYAFGECVSLQSIVFNEGMRHVNTNSFFNCTSIQTVTVPSSVSRLNGFKNCTSLTDIYYNDTLPFWLSIDKSGSELSDSVNINCRVNSKPPIVGMKVSEVTKNLYKLNEEFDDETGEITVTYEGGQTEAIAIRESMVKGFDTSETGTFKFNVEFGGFEDSIIITVYDGENPSPCVVGIKVTAPTKTTYFVGEDLDLTGGKITVSYNYGDPVELALDAEGVTVSGYDKTKAGNQTITVSYEDFTDTFEVTVNNASITGIEVTAPTKTTYFVGEDIDLTGGKITVSYNYGDPAELAFDAEGVTVSGYDKTKAGKQTITVSYEGFTDTFEVTVITNAPVVVNGKDYDTLSAALSANKTGDLEITINKSITEAKAITIPKTNTSAKITTAPGVTLTLGTPTITANCDLVLDAAVAPAKANAKTLTIKSAADKKVTINRIETSLPLTLSGAKTSNFILNTNSALNVLSAASVNVEISSGTTVVLNAGKLTPTTLSGAGKLNVYGASTVTIANVESADITLNQYEKTSGKNTTVLLPKFTVGTIKKMNLTVNDTAGSLADISGNTVVYLSKADAVANLENLITIANTANDKKLSAVQYKKEIRAEYLDAITVSDGSNSKNYSSFEKAFESMTNTSGNYTITLNESISASKITLPKTVASLTINGGGNTLKFVGMTSFAPKYAFSLENITIISEDNKGNAAAFTINSSTGNTTVDGLIFSGKSLTIKGGSGNDLTLGKCSRINTLSGFKAITINAAVEIEKTLTSTNLSLGSTANLTIGTGATATVKTSLTGVNGAKITLADAYKSFALNGTVNGDKIKLVSEKSLEDKIIFKTKLDLSGKFDVSGIAPANAGTLKYDLLTNGGNAYLKALAIDVNGTKYAFWNEAIAAITDKDTDYTITLLADVNIGAAFKLPAKGKFKSFTLNGNGHKLTFVGTSVSLTGNTTFRNITISSVNKKTGEAVAWKLTVGKFILIKVNIDLVSCTVK